MKCAAEPSLLVIQGPLKMLPGDSRIFFIFFLWGDTGDTEQGEGGGILHWDILSLQSTSLSVTLRDCGVTSGS